MSQINGKAVNQFIMTLHYNTQIVAAVVSAMALQLPFACKVIEASAVARAKGGTITAFTVDVLEAGTSILTSVMDLDAVAAGTVVVGAVSDATLTDNSKLSINLNMTGTTPTADDLTVALTLEKVD